MLGNLGSPSNEPPSHAKLLIIFESNGKHFHHSSFHTINVPSFFYECVHLPFFATNICSFNYQVQNDTSHLTPPLTPTARPSAWTPRMVSGRSWWHLWSSRALWRSGIPRWEERYFARIHPMCSEYHLGVGLVGPVWAFDWSAFFYWNLPSPIPK